MFIVSLTTEVCESFPLLMVCYEVVEYINIE
jgi:hypothetical protein